MNSAFIATIRLVKRVPLARESKLQEYFKSVQVAAIQNTTKEEEIKLSLIPSKTLTPMNPKSQILPDRQACKTETFAENSGEPKVAWYYGKTFSRVVATKLHKKQTAGPDRPLALVQPSTALLTLLSPSNKHWYQNSLKP